MHTVRWRAVSAQQLIPVDQIGPVADLHLHRLEAQHENAQTLEHRQVARVVVQTSTAMTSNKVWLRLQEALQPRYPVRLLIQLCHCLLNDHRLTAKVVRDRAVTAGQLPQITLIRSIYSPFRQGRPLAMPHHDSHPLSLSFLLAYHCRHDPPLVVTAQALTVILRNHRRFPRILRIIHLLSPTPRHQISLHSTPVPCSPGKECYERNLLRSRISLNLCFCPQHHRLT
jgi:hypothetical protein